MPDHVDEVYGDQARCTATLPIGADAAEVVAIAHPGANDARLPRPGDGQVRGLPANHLAKPELTVDEQHRALIHNRLDVGTHFETPAVDVVHVDRRHADAVGVVAL